MTYMLPPVSLPFDLEAHSRVAVKIVDDRAWRV